MTLLGISAIFVRLLGAPGVVSGRYRLMIAEALMVIPFAQRRRRAPATLSQRGAWIAALASLLFTLHLALWGSGNMLSGATNPMLIANTAPV